MFSSINTHVSNQARSDLDFHRELLPNAPRKEYRRRESEHKTALHWGQRKLLLSEIEFLTQYSKKGDTVVYAGAAPGTHIQFLIKLFQNIKFVLVDPAPFSTKLGQEPRCVLRQEMFTDDVAREYSNLDGILFICDIRSFSGRLLTFPDEEVEAHVKNDMEAQQRWHDIIKPKKSMLKFRLPWTTGCTEYLDGKVYFQAFAPCTSTETRLVPHGHDKVLWDNKKYEEQLFHFNTVTRLARYHHDMPVACITHGLDYCYDCRAEVHIIHAYLHRFCPELRGEEFTNKFCEMTLRFSRECSATRTLMHANVEPEQRDQGIRRRPWIDGKPAYHQDHQAPAKRVKHKHGYEQR